MVTRTESVSAAAPAPRYFYAESGEHPLLTLTMEPAGGLLHLLWSGDTDAATVKHGAGSILDAVRDWHPSLILNDGGQGAGDWQDLVPWLAFELAPQIAAGGVRAAAFLPPASAAGQLAMHTLTGEAPAGVLPLRLFATEREARAWLAQFVTA
ncbi:MAG: hypothetical protein H7330_10210 [Hymenobacteraceae bacterium]|nr:hypothetical protein [Hymenobacteraceae bacterium]